MAKIVADFPAYSIVEYEGQEFAPRAEFAVPFTSKSHGTLYHFFMIHSVAAYAAEYKNDVNAAVARAKANCHELHFAIPLPVILTAAPRAKVTRPCVNIGDVIAFDGKKFFVEAAPNNNVTLIESDGE